MASLIREDVQKLAVDHIVSLYELDCRTIGGDIYRFHNEETVNSTITFGGIEYFKRPIKMDGMEVQSNGQKPRPTMTIANLDGLVSGLILNLDDLLEARVLRIRTLAKFLDGMPEANPSQIYPIDTFYVTQKTSETYQVVQFALGDPSELMGVTLPRRKVSANTCVAKYRGEVCGYAGNPIAELDGTAIAGPFVDRGLYDPTLTYNAKDKVTVIDPDEVPHVYVCRHNNTFGIPPSFIASWAADECTKKLSRCKITHSSPYPFDGWPAAALLPNLA